MATVSMRSWITWKARRSLSTWSSISSLITWITKNSRINQSLHLRFTGLSLPESPGSPWNPAGPGLPDNPGGPIGPGAPDSPGGPGRPGGPSFWIITPESPGAPGAPFRPGLPGFPRGPQIINKIMETWHKHKLLFPNLKDLFDRKIPEFLASRIPLLVRSDP